MTLRFRVENTKSAFKLKPLGDIALNYNTEVSSNPVIDVRSRRVKRMTCIVQTRRQRSVDVLIVSCAPSVKPGVRIVRAGLVAVAKTMICELSVVVDIVHGSGGDNTGG